MSAEGENNVNDGKNAAEKEESEHKNGDAEANAPAEQGTTEPDQKTKRIHPSGKTIIVSNLPADMMFTYEEELRKIFSKHGNIPYIKLGGIPISADTVQPTLSAYVNFESAESSEAALAERGTTLGGNPIEIDILRAGEHTVVINQLPYVITKECLYKLLSPCGAIKDIIKIPARPTAFVEFEDEEGVKKALSLNGNLLMNNMQVNIVKRGAENEHNSKKPKKNMMNNSKRGAPAGGKRGGRGAMGRGGGGPRGQHFGGGFPSWEGPPQMGYRGGPRNFNPMPFNSWGNGNFRDNSMEERPFKRRKQFDYNNY